MRKAEKTRNYIIEQSADLFNKKGYAATSLADITDVTGLTKGSIYGNFKSKEDVAIAAFEYNASLLHHAVLQATRGNYKTQRERLIALTDIYRNNWPVFFKRGGCPLLNAATDADDTFPSLKKSVNVAFDKWADEIAKVISIGKEKGEFKKDINPTDYAFLFIMLIEGGILLAKSTNQLGHLMKSLDRVIQIIDQEISN